MSFLRSFYLTRFSTPAENRKVYQAICRIKARSILEFGVQRCVRSVQLLELATNYHRADEIRYTCVDPFESRSREDGPGLSLRKAYKTLVKSGARIRAIPDVPEDGLPQIRDLDGKVDFMVVATPSLDWVSEYADELAALMNSGGVIFLGASTADGRPFELMPCDIARLRDFRTARLQAVRRQTSRRKTA